MKHLASAQQRLQRMFVTVTLSAAAVMLPRVAAANVVWPALVLEMRIITWWAVLAGLLTEYVFLRSCMHMVPRRALAASLAMNAASTLIGVVLIPIAGIVWELSAAQLVHFLFDVGTFNPATWVATAALAVVCNAGVEAVVLRKAFGVPFGKQTFAVLLLANSVSIAVACVSIILQPPRL